MLLARPASEGIVHLMKAVVYADALPDAWQKILSSQAAIRDYLAAIGLEVVIDEAEGFAFLKQRVREDEMEETLPRLIQRRPLSFPASLLCVLLRRKLAEFDAAGGESRLVLSVDQIVEMLRIFLPDATNEARLVDQIEQHVGKLEEYGFLRRLRKDENFYEVRRILTALVDATWLESMNEKLQGYRKHAAGAV